MTGMRWASTEALSSPIWAMNSARGSPVAVRIVVTDSVFGQLCLPSFVMRLFLLKVV